MGNEKHETIADIVAKMREALLKSSVVMKEATHYLLTEEYVNECLAVVKAAISAPPRNCDVGTAEEQYKRHQVWCERKRCESILCRLCFARWSQMPYDGGVAK